MNRIVMQILFMCFNSVTALQLGLKRWISDQSLFWWLFRLYGKSL